MPVIYNAAATLNGYLADDHDSLQWLFDVPGSDAAATDIQSFLTDIDALVMGSTTYQWLLDALDSPQDLTTQYGDPPSGCSPPATCPSHRTPTSACSTGR